MKLFIALSFALVAMAFAGCSDKPFSQWVVRYEPTTDSERKAVAEQVAKILASTPRSLSGHDQDWDDAIAAATKSAKETLCRPTSWEHLGYGNYSGRWRYVDQPQPESTK